jgi:hypothetical protein
MKRDGIYDEFVWLHNEVSLATHFTVEFLPWHRYVCPCLLTTFVAIRDAL